MADKQPPTVVEGATGDVDDERPAAKSAEDRKAASALASLDASNDDSSAANVDQEAVSKAMKALGGGAGAAPKAAAKPAVKVDQADVALLVEELELTKPKATELLKAHEGDAVKAMSAYVAA
jgi:NACalpha-BTF3-like transcription factor